MKLRRPLIAVLAVVAVALAGFLVVDYVRGPTIIAIVATPKPPSTCTIGQHGIDANLEVRGIGAAAYCDYLVANLEDRFLYAEGHKTAGGVVCSGRLARDPRADPSVARENDLRLTVRDTGLALFGQRWCNDLKAVGLHDG